MAKNKETTSDNSRLKSIIRKIRKVWPVTTEMDKPFFILVLILTIFGTIMMFSASYVWGLQEINDGYYYVRKQAYFAIAGFCIMLIVSTFNYRVLLNSKVAWFIFSATIGLMIYTSLFGTSIHGARRWVQIGPISFQPSEILKFSLILIFSFIITKNHKRLDDVKYSTIPFLVIMGVVCVLMMTQRHFSGLLLLVIIGASVVFLSGMPFKNFMIFGGIGGIGVVGIIIYKVFVSGSGYFLDRIQGMLNPTGDVTSKTWQTTQSLIAIGSGGLFGRGFGESRQKYLYLPESQNDFVFSIVCEELGLIGALLVIALFVIFILRGFYIASRAKDKFGMLLVSGITIQIGAQALLNIAVACNAFPNTGISLPFFSYGGTALVMQLFEMGVILAVSRQSLTDG